MAKNKKAEIIRKLFILFNVKPFPTTETKFFRKLRNQQEELDNAFEYWLDQSKLVFGEVGKIEKIHGMKEAGIDLFLNLMDSRFKFGIQIKTFGDVKKKNFSNQVLSQKSLSLKHKLSSYLIAFAGDMTDESQNLKVRSMISELSQQGDNYAIPLSPEKVLTIYKVYKLNRHPLKHVFLDYSEALALLGGVADNLNNEMSNVQIKLKIKNLEKDGISRPHKFKMGLTFNKESKDKVKIIDDLKNQTLTDEVIKIDKSTVDSFKIKDGLSGTEGIKQEEKIWSWVEKPGRKFFSFQAISYNGSIIQSHDQVIDIKQEGDSTDFIPKDMPGQPVKIGFQMIPNTHLVSPTISFRFSGFDAKTILEGLNFLSSITNAPFVRIFIPEDNITIPLKKNISVPMIPLELLLLFRTLAAIEDITGTRFLLPEGMELNHNTVTPLIVTSSYILRILETKIIPKSQASIKIKPIKKTGIAMLKDYNKNLIKSNAMFVTHLSQPLLGYNILILDAQLDLGQYTPITKLSKVLKSKEDKEIELRPKST